MTGKRVREKRRGGRRVCAGKDKQTSSKPIGGKKESQKLIQAETEKNGSNISGKHFLYKVSSTVSIKIGDTLLTVAMETVFVFGEA
ncbi:hypothetical protein Y1Q_0006299 [Alligator mississippiensis]|uniref:Uncharacterized protein n=1 Tax=Alligator mississippiensis TaxID=8496 RepID=A0A151NXX5_ALLMI|nr:hypothetical protein Y1Q_0006299 [Alligator mississippiensis]